MHTLTALTPLLVPFITAAIGAIGLMAKDRRTARDARAIREHALAEANAQVQFASSWWQAQALLGEERADAARGQMTDWLAGAETIVAQAKDAPPLHRRPVTLKRLLLLGPVSHRAALVPRVLFWCSAVWLIFVAVVMASDIANRRAHSSVSGDVMLLVISGAIVLLLHLWAEAGDRPIASH